MAKANPATANSAGAPRAKAVMDNVSKALGADGNCYDVLVIQNCHDDEPVIGWITNDIINENAKI